MSSAEESGIKSLVAAGGSGSGGDKGFGTAGGRPRDALLAGHRPRRPPRLPGRCSDLLCTAATALQQSLTTNWTPPPSRLCQLCSLTGAAETKAPVPAACKVDVMQQQIPNVLGIFSLSVLSDCSAPPCARLHRAGVPERRRVAVRGARGGYRGEGGLPQEVRAQQRRAQQVRSVFHLPCMCKIRVTVSSNRSCQCWKVFARSGRAQHSTPDARAA